MIKDIIITTLFFSIKVTGHGPLFLCYGYKGVFVTYLRYALGTWPKFGGYLIIGTEVFKRYHLNLKLMEDLVAIVRGKAYILTGCCGQRMSSRSLSDEMMQRILIG